MIIIKDMGCLDGKVAFITGAARGQGRSHAVRLASEGADVIGIDVCTQMEKGYPGSTEADLDETARLVGLTGRSMVALKADVRDLEAVSAAVEAGMERFGRLDVVVANARIFSYGFLWEITAEQWRDMIDVNLTGLFDLVLEHSATLAPIFMEALPYMTMDPEFVSAMVAFLASDDSTYMTGAQIPIDMGTLIR